MRGRIGMLLLIACGLAAPVAAQTETIEYYGTDAIGSVRIVFDPSGVVLARQDYGPFGQPLLSAPAQPPEGFGGQSTDDEAQQSYFHARQFQARLGRFATIDSVLDGVFDPQRWNRYVHAMNNPGTFLDPYGLDPINVHSNPGCETFWYMCQELVPQYAFVDDFWLGSSQFPFGMSIDFDHFAHTHDTTQQKTMDTGKNSPPTKPTPPTKPKPPACDPTTGFNCTPPTNPRTDFWDGTKDAWNKGYYRCLAQKNVPGFGAAATVHAGGDAAVHATEHFAPQLAGAYYHFTDRRFTAWGKFSKVMVPELAESIELWAARFSAVGLAYADYELYRSVGECSETLR